MAIVRTYHCESCNTTFDKLHFDRAEPAPECPGCRALESRQVPAAFAIGGGAHSKAIDITQSIMERDLGQSNFKDNQREGDVAAITPPHLAAHVSNFFKPSGDIMAAAKVGAQASKAEGSNPLSIMQRQAKTRGSAKVICNPVNARR